MSLRGVVSTVAERVGALFGTLDRALVWLASPFGVNERDPRRRYPRLLGIFAGIYLIALLPLRYVPLAALFVGWVGVLAVGRAWVRNEKIRTEISKKIRDGNPDEMPDLRWTALVSALQLLILFPLFFQQVHEAFGFYRVPPDVHFWHWVLFTVDHYSKAVVGFLDLYGLHINRIEPEAGWGRHLVLIARLTTDYILIQGIVRIYAIHQTIREGVSAVKVDRDMAVRLGQRAVNPLIEAMQNDPNVEVRGRAAEALGKLGGPDVAEPLIEALGGRSELVRERAAKALAELGDLRAVDPLRKLAESDPDRYVKAAAEEAVKQLTGVPVTAPSPIAPLGVATEMPPPAGWLGRVKNAFGRLPVVGRKGGKAEQPSPQEGTPQT